MASSHSSASSAPAGRRAGWPTAMLVVVVAALALRAALVGRLGWSLLSYPFDVDYNEGFLLRDALVLAQGGALYTDVRQPPYWLSQYPPLYPFAMSLLIRAGAPAAWAGRAISLLSTVGVMGLIYAAARRLGAGRLAAAVAALLFPGSTYVVMWAPVVKGDLFGVGLAMLGFYLVSPLESASREGGRARAIAAAACFAAALYTRQSMIAGPLAVAAVLWRRRRAAAAWFSLTFLGLCAAAFAALQAATGGEFFRHIVTYNVGRFDVKEMAHAEFAFLRDHFMLVGAAAAALLRTRRRGRFRLLDVYLLLAWLVSFTCGRVGASSNYFLEPLALLCVEAGPALEGLRRQRPATAAAACAGLLLQASWVVNEYRGVDFWLRPPGAEAWEDGKRLVARLKAAPGDVLCDFHGYTLLAGRRVLLHHYMLTDLARRGLWDQTPILRRMKSGEISFVACDPVDMHRWTPEMMDILRRRYALVDTFLVYQIDGPRRLIGLSARPRG